MVDIRSDHFYKMFRYIWFNKFIFTIDIYPSELNFGFMIANTMKQWTFLKLRDSK